MPHDHPPTSAAPTLKKRARITTMVTTTAACAMATLRPTSGKAFAIGTALNLGFVVVQVGFGLFAKG